MELKDLELKMIVRIVKELMTDYLNEPCYGTMDEMLKGIKVIYMKLDADALAARKQRKLET